MGLIAASEGLPMLLRALVFSGLVVVCWAPCDAQTLVEGELIVADRGLTGGGGDGELRRYSRTGQFLGQLTPAGSGQIRGLVIAPTGEVYVARGNDVLRYAAGTLVPDPMPFATGVKAQDVAIDPVTGNVWCSFGAIASEAQILEVDPTGMVMQTITDPMLSHPRSLAFDLQGINLLVANGAGANVLAVDPTTGLVQQYFDLSGFPMGFDAIALSVDALDRVYVTGDWGLNQSIVRLTGPVGNVASTVWLDYSMVSGFNAPAGIAPDGHGNVYVACRERNMSVDGIYAFDATTAAPSIPPYTGTEHLNPIDLAFVPEELTITVTTPDGTDPMTGEPIVDVSSGQPSVVIDVFAPNFSGRPYGVIMSTLPAARCAGALATPQLSPGVFIAFGEPRTIPLVSDTFFIQTLIAAGQGSGPVDANFDPTGAGVIACPGSVPGTASFFSGVVDAAGHGTAILTLPSLPCLGFSLHLGIAAGIADGNTGPLGIAILTTRPNCVRLDP